MNGNYELLQELGFSNFPEKVIWAHNCGASNITIYLVAIVMLNVLKLNVEDVKEKKRKRLTSSKLKLFSIDVFQMLKLSATFIHSLRQKKEWMNIKKKNDRRTYN